MDEFQVRLKRHMDKGATYLEALRLLKTTDQKEPSKVDQTLKRKAKDRHTQFS